MPSSEVQERKGKPARVVVHVLLLASLILFLAIAFPIWKPLVVAAVLAAALIGPYRRLLRSVRSRKYVASAIMTIAVFILIVVPLAGLTAFAIVEGIEAARNIIALLRSENGLERLLTRLPDKLEGWARRAMQVVPPDGQTLQDRAAAGGRIAASTVANVAEFLSSLLLNLVFMLIAFFFLLADGPALVRWIAAALPLKERQTGELLHEFREMSRVVLGSNLATGGLQATVATIGYFIAPVPRPLFFGLLTFVVSFIPSVGTAIVSLPLSALLALTGKPMWALFLLGWSLGLVAMVDNLVRPWLLRGRQRVHGAIFFFAFIGGIALLGPVGLLVGPLAVTFLIAMVRLWQRDFNPAREMAPLVSPGVPAATAPQTEVSAVADDDHLILTPPAAAGDRQPAPD